MNLPRKILVVHADARARRRLMLILVEAGYDVRASAQPERAVKAGETEWFDLALVDFALPGGEGFAFTGRLRAAQPTLPVIMLLPEFELPLIIQSIRAGVTDVLLAEDDPRPVLRRVHTLLRPVDAVAPADLAEVEDVLARFDGADDLELAPGGVAALREQLVRVTQERAALEADLEQLRREKRAVEIDLQTLLTQGSDAARLQAERAELRSQREMAATAQFAIEAKARELEVARAEIAAERCALEEAKRGLAGSRSPFVPCHPDLELERAHLAAVREDLRDEDERLRAEAVRLRQDNAQLAQERRRWHEELEELRDREENLRTYEQRLRALQGQLEAERLALHAGAPREDFSQRDSHLRAEWEKLHRANELLEAERAVFRDERMALRDLEQTIRAREERLRQLEQQVAAHEMIRRHLPPPAVSPPPAVPAPEPERAPGKPRGVLQVLTRAPFAIWGKGQT